MDKVLKELFRQAMIDEYLMLHGDDGNQGIFAAAVIGKVEAELKAHAEWEAKRLLK